MTRSWYIQAPRSSLATAREAAPGTLLGSVAPLSDAAPHPFGDILPLRQQAAETRKKVVDQLQGGAFILMQVRVCDWPPG